MTPEEMKVLLDNSAASKLYHKYLTDLKQLQETCPHDQISDFLPLMRSGKDIRACLNCNKWMGERVRHYNGGPVSDQAI